MSKFAIPEYKNIGLDVVFNQGRTSACTAYALAGCVNILGYNIDPKLLRDEVVIGPASAGSWRVRGAINYAKKKGWITYDKPIEGINDLGRSIRDGNPIILETHNLDFTATNKTSDKIAIFGDIIYRHARHICGIDRHKRLIIGRNSYGEKRGDKGNFYIKFSDFRKLGTMYKLG